MGISEIKDMLSLADVLIVGYDDGTGNDVAALTIAKIMRDNKIRILKCVHGDVAETMYKTLIDTQ